MSSAAGPADVARYRGSLVRQALAFVRVEVLLPLLEAVEAVEEHRSVRLCGGDLAQVGMAGEDVPGHLLKVGAGDPFAQPFEAGMEEFCETGVAFG